MVETMREKLNNSEKWYSTWGESGGRGVECTPCNAQNDPLGFKNKVPKLLDTIFFAPHPSGLC